MNVDDNRIAHPCGTYPLKTKLQLECNKFTKRDAGNALGTIHEPNLNHKTKSCDVVDLTVASLPASAGEEISFLERWLSGLGYSQYARVLAANGFETQRELSLLDLPALTAMAIHLPGT